MDAKSDYVYQPLSSPSSTRLIELQPGNPHDALNCRLVESTVDGTTAYEAISYVWGNEASVTTIICNGGRLQITKSLAGALDRFRKSNEVRVLWADAICINQRDESEKNKQVLLMADLYRNAKEVLVWLGPAYEYEDTDAAFECLRLLLRQVFPKGKDLDKWMKEGRFLDHGAQTTRNREKLNKYLGIPSAGSSCKLPSDLVYSILGTASDKPQITPDYSVPFERVFASATAEIIKTSENLSILSHACPWPGKHANLPSWVPDWRDSLERIPSFSSKARALYSATGSARTVLDISSDGTELQLQSVLWDTISAVRGSSSLMIGGWIQEQLHKSRSFTSPTDKTMEKVLTRLRCTDLKLHQLVGDQLRWDANSWAEIEVLLKEANSSTQSPRYELLIQAMTTRNEFTAVLATQKKRLGMGSQIAQPGDKIALLLGGEVPIVLRPIGDKYTFVCECYVDGFMDGEGLVEARHEAQPHYDVNDTSWLQRLHEQPFPFETQTFTIK